MSNLNAQVLVHDFHKAFGHPTFDDSVIKEGVNGQRCIFALQPNVENLTNKKIAELRFRLFNEEIKEGVDASGDFVPTGVAEFSSFIEVVDAIGDILYITLGTGCAYGLALDTPSFDYAEEVYQVQGENHRGLIDIYKGFSEIEKVLVELELDVHFACQAPSKALLFASPISKQLQKIVDLCYAHAEVYGYDLNAVFTEIHNSNMSKLGADGKPIYREDGKILKGENYFKPDIAKVLNAADKPASTPA
jgi:predicted HAD superfamily Cof-like phosphohydrolase